MFPKLIFVLILSSVCLISCSELKEKFVQLPLDHFDFLNHDKFDAKYYINDDHWNPGGVIYVFVTSGGYENHQNFLKNGLIHDLASETNGMLLSLEQRFFGYSQTSFNVSLDSLKYLTIDQSLADIAMFIDFIRKNNHGALNSKVVLWGRGYGGSFAVWMRQKYPHLVDAVFASSASLELKFGYPELLTNTFDAFNKVGGSECGDVITNAMNTIEQAIIDKNLSEVGRKLKFCSPIELDREENLPNIFSKLSIDASNFISSVSAAEINNACAKLRGQGNSGVNDFERFASWYIDDFVSNKIPCVEFNYFKSMNRTRSSEIHPFYATSIATHWVFCTQMGSWGVSNGGKGHPFGKRLTEEFFYKRCAEIFSDGNRAFDRESLKHLFIHNNLAHGGLKPEVTHVILTKGELDPRFNLQPLKDINELAPVLVMEGKLSFTR